MDELYKKIDNFKTRLNQEKSIQDLLVSMKKIKENLSLVNKIQEYNSNPSEKLKKEILNDSDIIKYKHLENEVNFLILEIKKELKKIVGNGGCSDCK